MWFSEGLESYGVKYAEHFNPISLSTIALVATMVSSERNGVQYPRLTFN